MAAACDFGRQRCRQIVRFIAWRVPTGDAECFEPWPSSWAFPAEDYPASANVRLYNRADTDDASCRLRSSSSKTATAWVGCSVLNQVVQSHADRLSDTGEPLHGVNTADQVQGINNQQVYVSPSTSSNNPRLPISKQGDDLASPGCKSAIKGGKVVKRTLIRPHQSSLTNFIAGNIRAARQLHAVLCDEALQQTVHFLH
jgi:hypothetical protein